MTTFTRRLQKIGSSILVSLPKEWVDANNLKKSNQVEIETNQNNLSIRTQLNKRPSKEVVISYPLSKGEGIVPTITGAYLLGFDIIRHPFPDHHNFVSSDINYLDHLPIIMTEKDASKCKDFKNKFKW